MRITDFVREARGEKTFAFRLAVFNETYLAPESPVPLDHAMVDEDAEFHYALLRHIIDGTANLNPSQLKRVTDMYLRFRILIPSAKLPQASKEIVRELAKGGTYVGYVSQSAVMLRTADGWAAAQLEPFGIGRRQHENDVVVGFVPEAISGPVRKAASSQRLKLLGSPPKRSGPASCVGEVRRRQRRGIYDDRQGRRVRDSAAGGASIVRETAEARRLGG